MIYTKLIIFCCISSSCTLKNIKIYSDTSDVDQDGKISLIRPIIRSFIVKHLKINENSLVIYFKTITHIF